MEAKGNTLVLLSGGIDSSATLALCRRHSRSVSALFVDYGQAGAALERAAAKNVAGHYETKLSMVLCVGLGKFEAGYIRGRNALLLQIALSAANFDVGQVAIGLHAGTSYVDCTEGFVVEMQRCFDIYAAGKLQIVAPFIDLDKRGVVSVCRELGVPLHLTYSCERGASPPCGTCLSCLDRTALHV